MIKRVTFDTRRKGETNAFLMVFYGVFRESAGEKVKLQAPVYLERMIDIIARFGERGRMAGLFKDAGCWMNGGLGEKWNGRKCGVGLNAAEMNIYYRGLHVELDPH